METKYVYEEKKLLANIPEGLRFVMEKVGAFVAGGAITSIFSNKDINDFDIYVPDKKSAVAILAWCFGKSKFTYVESSSYEARVVSVTDKSFTFIAEERHFQVILFDYFSTPEEIFNKFDFTCCMAAYSFKEKEFVLHPDFLLHLSQRRLMFNKNTKYPFVSALRVDKYKQKGFSISKSQFMRILLACGEKEINSWEELASQMAGLYGCFTKDVFDITKEFSKEEAFIQLDKLQLPDKPTHYLTTNCSFSSILNEIHGSDLVEVEKPPYREGYYYKRVTNELTSFYRRDFKYPVGEVVDGGKLGIFIDHNVKEPYFSTERTVVELELMEGASVVLNTSFNKHTLLGPVKVVRSFKVSVLSDIEELYVIPYEEGVL